MGTNHPNIILDFVPGGCTGVHQPCDVCIQRQLKVSMRKSYHEDIVNELLTELDNGNSTTDLNDTLGVLRDHSVHWMWNSYQAPLNNEELVKKAFEGCVVREWNLSTACVISFEGREALRQMAKANPKFWAELGVDHPDDM
ncbi:hypothetical protein GALMADRAFT_284170 [Galerina marginata CBS 339.88]|uniref:Uncharacterized protein n=1 Tax=Galerina marginata (strain CBS 339.88) TaxID=685588 RepID=A0A067S3B4_GALM3|nr:hypothetical protein GALMADRAFT_284170 [Galerina marginata CBS 339.88]